MPFGGFLDTLPQSWFLVIHAALASIGVMLWRRARTAGLPSAARGFALYVIGEACYVVYHLDFITFLFAHGLAEVCDGLALLSIGLGLTRKRA
jgi:hypothetical protein